MKAPKGMIEAHNDGRHGVLPNRDLWFTEHCPRCAEERLHGGREAQQKTIRDLINRAAALQDAIDLQSRSPYTDSAVMWAASESLILTIKHLTDEVRLLEAEHNREITQKSA